MTAKNSVKNPKTKFFLRYSKILGSLRKDILLIAVLFAVLSALGSYLSTTQKPDTPHIDKCTALSWEKGKACRETFSVEIKQEREKTFQALPAIMGVGLVNLFILILAAYVLQQKILLLQREKIHELSKRGFYRFLKTSLWVGLRPCLWLLLPIIGAFFYVRSVVRYMLAPVLSFLYEDNAGGLLKKSWSMTEGRVWRMIGFFVAILFITIFFEIVLALFIVLPGILFGFSPDQSAVVAGGVVSILGLILGSITPLAIYMELKDRKIEGTAASEEG